MAVTIRDVARAVGVSISTVSRSLSSPDGVAEETRLRVQDAARTMGYHPNRSARGLITGRTSCIGLVVPDLENPFFASICKGVQARARLMGHAVFIADAEEDAAVEADVIRSLLQQVDGLILCSPRGSDLAVERFAREKPLVLVNRRVGEVPALTFDNGGGVRAAVRHLMALGHRRIAYAGGPSTSWSDGKRAAALRAVAERSSDLDVIELGNFPPFVAGGVQAADLAIASEASAVMAFNDLMAVGVLDRLRQRGVRVPQDVSVTSFDDIPIAGLTSPALTTVNFPRAQMGRDSVDVLMDVLGRAVDTHPMQEVPVHLVVRSSTGVAPPASPAPPQGFDARSIELPL